MVAQLVQPGLLEVVTHLAKILPNQHIQVGLQVFVILILVV